jgi:5-methylcytosine-specific restriction endonuclease McrA
LTAFFIAVMVCDHRLNPEAVWVFSKGFALRTLVLNASYEPLAVVSFKRALILVLNNKAKVLQGVPKYRVRSANSDYECPSVILLSRYVRVPSSRVVPLFSPGCLRRDSYRCAYCDRSADTIDHVQPKIAAVVTPGKTSLPVAFAATTKKVTAL